VLLVSAGTTAGWYAILIGAQLIATEVLVFGRVEKHFLCSRREEWRTKVEPGIALP